MANKTGYTCPVTSNENRVIFNFLTYRCRIAAAAPVLAIEG